MVKQVDKTDKLKNKIKIELKTFGCQWDLIGEKDPEDIAEESANEILKILRKEISKLDFPYRGTEDDGELGFDDGKRCVLRLLGDNDAHPSWDKHSN